MPAIVFYAILSGMIAFFYVRMNIEVALLNRKISIARSEVRDWERKNSALKSELARIGGEGYEQMYFKLYGALPLYEDNQVVRIQLPEKSDDGFFSNKSEPELLSEQENDSE